MATAAELLNSEEIAARTYTINSDLRTITPPPNFKILGVESDDDVARVYFKGPRFYKGVDLSTFRVRVNILNAEGEEDGYSVDDLQVDDDTSMLIFSWLIGRHTAQYEGEIKFSLCFRELDENAYVIREFNTTIAKGTILDGLETSTLILQKYPDLIDNIILRLENLEENGIPLSSLDTTLTIEGKAADAKAVGDAIVAASTAGVLVVTIEALAETGVASHTSTQILEHVNKGGDVVLQAPLDTAELPGQGGYTPLANLFGDNAYFTRTIVSAGEYVEETTLVIDADGNYSTTTAKVEASSGTGMTEEQAAQLEANTAAIAEINNPVVSGALNIETQKYMITLTLEDGSTETHILETDENEHPVKLTVNGNEIPWTTTVAEV